MQVVRLAATRIMPELRSIRAGNETSPEIDVRLTQRVRRPGARDGKTPAQRRPEVQAECAWHGR